MYHSVRFGRFLNIFGICFFWSEFGTEYRSTPLFADLILGSSGDHKSPAMRSETSNLRDISDLKHALSSKSSSDYRGGIHLTVFFFLEEKSCTQYKMIMTIMHPTLSVAVGLHNHFWLLQTWCTANSTSNGVPIASKQKITRKKKNNSTSNRNSGMVWYWSVRTVKELQSV